MDFMVVKPTSGVQPPVSPPTTASQGPQQSQAAKPTQTTATQMPAGLFSPEAVSQALKKYKQLVGKMKQPFLSGAAGLFSDKVIFPEELLDPKNPANDPRYLHLLCAVFGLKELERYFSSPEQSEELDEEDEGKGEHAPKGQRVEKGPKKSHGQKQG